MPKNFFIRPGREWRCRCTHCTPWLVAMPMN